MCTKPNIFLIGKVVGTNPQKIILIQAILLEHGFEHKTSGAGVTTLTSFRSASRRAKSFMTTKSASDSIWYKMLEVLPSCGSALWRNTWHVMCFFMKHSQVFFQEALGFLIMISTS